MAKTIISFCRFQFAVNIILNSLILNIAQLSEVGAIEALLGNLGILDILVKNERNNKYFGGGGGI